jgi:hypothetical protein
LAVLRLIDDTKGIPISTRRSSSRNTTRSAIPRFRIKAKNGKLTPGSPAWRPTRRPADRPPRVGAEQDRRPEGHQVYVLYKFVDLDTTAGTIVWVTLTAALMELKSHGGIMDGELSFAEIAVHHTTDANNDIFQVVDATSDDVTKTVSIGTGVTGYTMTVTGSTTPSITTLTSDRSADRSAGLVERRVYRVTVTGTGGAPGTLTAVFTVSRDLVWPRRVPVAR